MPSSLPASVRITTVALRMQMKEKANKIKVSHGLRSPAMTATRRVSSTPSQPSR